MIFFKQKGTGPFLPVIFLLSTFWIITTHGQESITASFSLENNILDVPALEVQGVGYYKTKLALVENSRFKLTVIEQSDWAKTDNVFQTATSKMILPVVSVLQGGVIIARYELQLLLEDAEKLFFSLSYVNELPLDTNSSREKICNDYGCFELQSKLAKQEDGEISSSGISLKKVLWERDELDNIRAQNELPSFSSIERVGYRASPSVAVVYGDWCMNQSPNADLDQPVFHSTVPGLVFS